jgi:hypothetical protein
LRSFAAIGTGPAFTQTSPQAPLLPTVTQADAAWPNVIKRTQPKII